MDAPTPTSGRLAGYRVVRKLAAGSRADVFLGSGNDGVVAVKVFRPDVAAASIAGELEALGRINLGASDARHFVRMVDIDSAVDEVPMLVLERVARGSVAALLRDRESIDAGEVVTLLAPLAASLPALHRVGVAHGNIGASSLHLGASGEPVLLGFGHCQLFARGGSVAAIDDEPAAARDRNDLADLALALLGHAREAHADGRVTSLIRWIDDSPREFEFCERLESRLFELADPLPIDFGRRAATPTVPGRAVSAVQGAGTVQADPEARAVSESSATAARGNPRSGSRVHPVLAVKSAETTTSEAGFFSRLDSLLRDNPIEVAKSRFVTFARGVRKRFWVAAAGGALGLILAIALIPASSPASTPPAAAISPSTVTPTAASTIVPVPADPVAALAVLLSNRADCIRSRSVLCLDQVDDEASSAYASDSALIQGLQGGDELPASAAITAPDPTLSETLGASALVSLGPRRNPAAVLMIRTTAGWRIRGYLSGVQATGSPTTGD